MTILSQLTLTKKTKASMFASMHIGQWGAHTAEDGTGQIQFATAKTEGTGGLQTTPNPLRHNPHVSR